MSDTIHQALISHVGAMHPYLFRPAISRLKHCVPVYTYLVTGYFTPEKLGDIVWYVSAVPTILPFIHS